LQEQWRRRNRTRERFRSGLPPNIKIGQLRRTVPIVPANEWSSLTRDERDAANAITLHVWKRTRQKRHPAFDGDETFLTNRHVQRLLKAVNASNTGEKAARNALAAMQKHGWIVDTGRTKKPRRPPASIERAEAFGPPGSNQAEGGRYAQPGLSGRTGGECSKSRHSPES
jgi:hypothetical protein